MTLLVNDAFPQLLEIAAKSLLILCGYVWLFEGARLIK